ncbi:MAG: carbohydrate kinase family protein [Haloarculaceae archaeon]
MPRNLVSVGSAIVDRYHRLSNLPEPDGGAFVRESWEGFGGVAANVACAVSRLGLDAGVVSRLGDDGDAVAENLREWGVDTDYLQYGGEASTYSIVLRDPAGERMITTGGEAARSLAFDLSGSLAELADRGTAPGTIDAAVASADLFVADTVALRSYLDHHDTPFGPRETERVVEWFRDRGVRRAALAVGSRPARRYGGSARDGGSDPSSAGCRSPRLGRERCRSVRVSSAVEKDETDRLRAIRPLGRGYTAGQSLPAIGTRRGSDRVGSALVELPSQIRPEYGSKRYSSWW